MQAWRVDSLCTSDITVAAIVVNKKVVYVTFTNCDININLKIVLGKLLQYCHTRKVPLLVGADSNAHSSIWGCLENNDRGQDLEDLLDQCELTVLNVGNTPTYFRTEEDGTKTESIIDITVTNKFANDINVNDWQVLEEETDSDHKYIGYTFGQYQPIRNYFRNYKRAPWMLFKTYCEIAANSILGMKDTLELNWEDPRLYIDGKGRNLYHKKDKLYKRLQKVITEVDKYSDVDLEVIITRTISNNRLMEVWQGPYKVAPYKEASTRNPMAWWNDSLQQLKDIKQILSRKKNDAVFKDKYKEHIKVYRKEIDRAREAGWQDFCTKTESAKQTSQVMKILEGKKRGGRISIIDEGESSLLSPESSLKYLMDTHFEEHTTINVETVSANDTDNNLHQVVDYIQ